MKIEKQKRFNKKIIALAVVLIILIVSAFTYVYAYNGSLFGWKKAATDTSTKPATQEQIDNGNSIKQNTVNSSSNSSKGSTATQSPSPSSSPGNGKANVGVVITAANQNSSILQIRSIVDLLTNSGTCTLTLTKGAQTVTKTANVQAQVSTSACQGFDVPVSELSVGTWNIAIHFENDQYKGDALTTVSIQ